MIQTDLRSLMSLRITFNGERIEVRLPFCLAFRSAVIGRTWSLEGWLECESVTREGSNPHCGVWELRSAPTVLLLLPNRKVGA